MRLLLLNPNTTEAMTKRLNVVATAFAAQDTEIIPRTATRGVPYISCRAEAQIAGTVALEMIAAEPEPVDAVILAAFGDPGLRAARELFDIPVVGMAEASLLTACFLGERFGIVTFTPHMTPWYREAVRDAGLLARCTGLRTPSAVVGAVTDVQETMRTDLVRLANEAAAVDGADAVILGGAPLAGLAAEVQNDVPAVLIDPISAAVGAAETLARLAPRGSDRGGFTRPPGKSSTGLYAPLATHLSHKQED